MPPRPRRRGLGPASEAFPYAPEEDDRYRTVPRAGFAAAEDDNLASSTGRLPLLEEDNQEAAVGTVAVSGGVSGVLHRVWWQVVGQRFGFIGFLETAADVVALAIDGRIDLVGHAVVPLVLGKTNVVSAGPDPDFLPVPGERGFPQAEVMAAGDHGDRFSHFVSEILFSAE